MKRVQLIRHITSAAALFIGKIGEITVDLSKKTLRVHDGVTAGGQALAREDLASTAAASVTQDGKMTIAHVTALAAATATLPTKADKIAPSAANNIALLDAYGNLVDGGRPFFQSGTRMLFQQTAAPTGWVKETNAAYNNKALRLVTGSVSTGGAAAFTSVFGADKVVGDTTLSVNQIPPHTHGAGTLTTASNGAHTHTVSITGTPDSNVQGVNQIAGGPDVNYTTSSNGAHTHTISGSTAQNTSTWQPHNHTLPLDLAYVDFIIAARGS